MRDTPVLDLAPRAHADAGGWSDRVYLLWPAWMYQVVAPSAQARTINVFQKAMLGLCRAGVRTAAEAARDLELDPQLAAFIAKELQERGLIDDRWAPTARGLELIDEESYDAGELRPGFVFRDACGGALWPRYVERIEYAAIEGSVAGDRYLLFGTQGDPYRVRPVEIGHADRSAPSAPQSTDVLDAALRHRRVASRRVAVAHIDDDGGQPSAPPAAVRRVFVSREPPRLVHLVTFVYCPEQVGRTGEWFVADPFGLGASPTLRAGVEARLAGDERLRERIEKLVGVDLAKAADEVARFRESVRGAARDRVVAALTADACSASAYDHLVELEFHRIQAETLDGSESETERRHAALAARKALESAFADLKRLFPLVGVWKVVAPYRQYADLALKEQVFERSASSLGLVLPKAFRKIPVGQLQAACDYGDSWRLRPAALATVLAASCRSDHPVRAAASSLPTLLEDVDYVANLAGESAHHRRTAPDRGVSGDEVAARTYRVVDVLSRASVSNVAPR